MDALDVKRAIYDISRPIEPGIAVWPDDIAYAITRNQRLETGAAVNLSDIRLSVHTGTHVDAPNHFLPEGRGIDGTNLSFYIGPARVVGIPAGDAVAVDALRRWDWSRTPRCLLKTGGSADNHCFDPSFMPVSEEAARYLVQQGICLVGTDSPSVDAFSSKKLPVHLIFGQGGVAILESLQLGGVPEGEYELIALPLRLVGLDGSPVRAILRSCHTTHSGAKDRDLE